MSSGRIRLIKSKLLILRPKNAWICYPTTTKTRKTRDATKYGKLGTNTAGSTGLMHVRKLRWLSGARNMRRKRNGRNGIWSTCKRKRTCSQDKSSSKARLWLWSKCQRPHSSARLRPLNQMKAVLIIRASSWLPHSPSLVLQQPPSPSKSAPETSKSRTTLNAWSD